jgi:hypothetical protein
MVAVSDYKLRLNTKAYGTLSSFVKGTFCVPVPANTYGRWILRRVDEVGISQLGDLLPTDYSYNINTAELVMVQEGKKSSDNTPKVYTTWKMEPSLIDYNTNKWQKQFILEPNVSNALLLYPEQLTDGKQSLYSIDNNLATYRWSLDNIDNTNRDVQMDSALYYDKLIETLNNTGVKIKNINDDFGGTLLPMKIYTAMDSNNIYMDNKTHTLQIVLNAGIDLQFLPKNLYLFKQVVKTL